MKEEKITKIKVFKYVSSCMKIRLKVMKQRDRKKAAVCGAVVTGTL